jgi:hypothetical protein
VKCRKKEFKKIERTKERKIFSFIRLSGSEDEMIEQLKKKFQVTRRKSESFQMLMVLPKRKKLRRIQQEFKAKNYMVWTLKKLVAEKGVLSSLNVKEGKLLPPAAGEMGKQVCS